MNKLFQYIKNLLNPKKFNHNPEDFALKAKEAEFGGGWFHVMYTANGGRNWEHLFEVRSPLFDHRLESLYEYKWGWHRQSFRPEKKSLNDYKIRFKSYQDILDFYDKEEKRLIEGKQDRLNRIKVLEEKISKNLK